MTKLYGVGLWTAQLAVAIVSRDFLLGPAGDLAVARGLAIVLRLGEEEAKVVAKRLLEQLPSFGSLVLYLVAYEYEESRRKKRGGARRDLNPGSPSPKAVDILRMFPTGTIIWKHASQAIINLDIGMDNLETRLLVGKG